MDQVMSLFRCQGRIQIIFETDNCAVMKAWHIIVDLALCLLCFLAGRHTNRAGGELVGKNDTLILYDTIRYSIPYPVYETVIQTVPEMFPIYITLEGDTVREPIFVPIRITQKEYLTDDYHAWVSGYNPSLDSIDIFRKTMSITKRQSSRRWGIGITAGYGIGRNGLSPYVGIGGYYRIW